MTFILHDEIAHSLPQLRAVAVRMARDRVLADDLVQETILRALLHADQFRPGTNLKAWLVTILRNSFFSVKRSEKRLAQFAARMPSAPSAVGSEQEGHVALNELKDALSTLPQAQREAVALVGARGFSYGEAAQIAGCGIGTIKSRTSRARASLRKLLDGTVAGIPGDELESAPAPDGADTSNATTHVPLRYAA